MKVHSSNKFSYTHHKQQRKGGHEDDGKHRNNKQTRVILPQETGRKRPQQEPRGGAIELEENKGVSFWGLLGCYLTIVFYSF